MDRTAPISTCGNLRKQSRHNIKATVTLKGHFTPKPGHDQLVRLHNRLVHVYSENSRTYIHVVPRLASDNRCDQ